MYHFTTLLKSETLNETSSIVFRSCLFKTVLMRLLKDKHPPINFVGDSGTRSAHLYVPSFVPSVRLGQIDNQLLKMRYPVLLLPAPVALS